MAVVGRRVTNVITDRFVIEGVERYVNSVNRVTRTVRRSRGQIGLFHRAAANLFTLYGLVMMFNTMSRAVHSLGESVISGVGALEMMRVELEVLTGRAGEGAKALMWLQKVAVRTPFQIPDLVEAATQLKAWGMNLNETIPLLTDAAVAMGVTSGSLARVANMMGRVVRRGANWGRTLTALRGDLSVFNQVLAETGDRFKALQAALAHTHGITEEVFMTLPQLMSNFKDAIGIITRFFAVATGFYDKVRNAFAKLTLTAIKFSDVLSEVNIFDPKQIEKLRGAAKRVLKAFITDVISYLIDVARPLIYAFFAEIGAMSLGLLDGIRAAIKNELLKKPTRETATLFLTGFLAVPQPLAKKVVETLLSVAGFKKQAKEVARDTSDVFAETFINTTEKYTNYVAKFLKQFLPAPDERAFARTLSAWKELQKIIGSLGKDTKFKDIAALFSDVRTKFTDLHAQTVRLREAFRYLSTQPIPESLGPRAAAIYQRNVGALSQMADRMAALAQRGTIVSDRLTKLANAGKQGTAEFEALTNELSFINLAMEGLVRASKRLERNLAEVRYGVAELDAQFKKSTERQLENFDELLNSVGPKLDALRERFSQPVEPRINVEPVRKSLETLQEWLSQPTAPKVDLSPVQESFETLRKWLSEPIDAEINLTPVQESLNTLRQWVSQPLEPTVDLDTVRQSLETLNKWLSQLSQPKVDLDPVRESLEMVNYLLLVESFPLFRQYAEELDRLYQKLLSLPEGSKEYEKYRERIIQVLGALQQLSSQVSKSNAELSALATGLVEGGSAAKDAAKRYSDVVKEVQRANRMAEGIVQMPKVEISVGVSRTFERQMEQIRQRINRVREQMNRARETARQYARQLVHLAATGRANTPEFERFAVMLLVQSERAAELADLLRQLGEAYTKLAQGIPTEEVEGVLRDWQRAAVDVATTITDSFSRAFADVVTGANNMRDSLSEVFDEIKRMIIETAIKTALIRLGMAMIPGLGNLLGGASWGNALLAAMGIYQAPVTGVQGGGQLQREVQTLQPVGVQTQSQLRVVPIFGKSAFEGAYFVGVSGFDDLVEKSQQLVRKRVL